MQFHEIANVWPMLDDEKLSELVDDIKLKGLINPIWTFEGKILDGRNRFRACLIAQVKPVFKEYTGDEPTAFAVSLNDKRRHMNKGALAAVAAELEPYFAKDAEKRYRDTVGRPNKSEEKIPQIHKCPDCFQPYETKHGHVCKKRKPQAREEAAKSVGVNDRYVSDAKKVKNEAPEIFEQLKSGKITLQDAKREVAKKPTDDWRADERERQSQVQSGVAVVANQSSDKNLIAWAERENLAVRIDRSSKYGNPFIMGQDGNRDDVCNSFEVYYLPNKPSILIDSPKLKGKVLICHCYPERCHGDCLKDLANGVKSLGGRSK